MSFDPSLPKAYRSGPDRIDAKLLPTTTTPLLSPSSGPSLAQPAPARRAPGYGSVQESKAQDRPSPPALAWVVPHALSRRAAPAQGKRIGPPLVLAGLGFGVGFAGTAAAQGTPHTAPTTLWPVLGGYLGAAVGVLLPKAGRAVLTAAGDALGQAIETRRVQAFTPQQQFDRLIDNANAAGLRGAGLAQLLDKLAEVQRRHPGVIGPTAFADALARLGQGALDFGSREDLEHLFLALRAQLDPQRLPASHCARTLAALVRGNADPALAQGVGPFFRQALLTLHGLDPQGLPRQEIDQLLRQALAWPGVASPDFVDQVLGRELDALLDRVAGARPGPLPLRQAEEAMAAILQLGQALPALTTATWQLLLERLAHARLQACRALERVEALLGLCTHHAADLDIERFNQACETIDSLLGHQAWTSQCGALLTGRSPFATVRHACQRLAASGVNPLARIPATTIAASFAAEAARLTRPMVGQLQALLALEPDPLRRASAYAAIAQALARREDTAAGVLRARGLLSPQAVCELIDALVALPSPPAGTARLIAALPQLCQASLTEATLRHAVVALGRLPELHPPVAAVETKHASPPALDRDTRPALVIEAYHAAHEYLARGDERDAREQALRWAPEIIVEEGEGGVDASGHQPGSQLIEPEDEPSGERPMMLIRHAWSTPGLLKELLTQQAGNPPRER